MSTHRKFILLSLLLIPISLLIISSFSSFTFSESSLIVDSYGKKYNVNQTTIYNNCDFLNLCQDEIERKSNGMVPLVNNGIVDISYLKIDIQLPFP